MESSEAIQAIPDLLGRYIDGADLKPLLPPVPDGGTVGSWTYTLDGIVTLVNFLGGDSAELRITNGLAIDVPYKHEVLEYVNWLSMKQLVLGRLFVTGDLPFMIESGNGLCAVFMQEIVFADSLSFEYTPSIQALVNTVGRLGGQGSRVASEILERFGGRRVTEDEAGILLNF
jgi:hypothetical protein